MGDHRDFAFTDTAAFPTERGTKEAAEASPIGDERIRAAARFVYDDLNHATDAVHAGMDWGDDDQIQAYIARYHHVILSVLGVSDAWPSLVIADIQSPPPDRIFFVVNNGRPGGINAEGLYHPGDDADDFGAWEPDTD